MHGPEIAPETDGAERATYHDVILTERLRAAIERINPDASQMARAQVLARLRRPGARVDAREPRRARLAGQWGRGRVIAPNGEIRANGCC